MAKRRITDEEKKARAYTRRDEHTKAKVIAELFAGEAVRDITKKYKIPESTVRTWRDNLTDEDIARVRERRSTLFDDLLLDALEVALRATITISKEVSKPSYIAKQNASDMGYLYGVMMQKTLMLTEAMQRASDAVQRRSESTSDTSDDDEDAARGVTDETRLLPA
jgi:hypothetical protein